MKIILLAFALLAVVLPLHAADAPKSTPAARPDGVQTFTGKVLETMNAASYTYVCVATGKATNWAAAAQFDVKVGDTVTVYDGMPMPGYHSKTLNRDFDVCFFSSRATVAGAAAVPGAASAAALNTRELPKDHPAIGAVPSVTDFSSLKRPADGKTVAEIVTGRLSLSGKPVTVRGKIVKYNSGVLGKNWLHIRDGSGQAGGNDLTVTTSIAAKVGDTVLVVGKVVTDRDFCAGYKYAVIIEDAEVTVE